MTTLELLEYISQERAALAGCYPLPSPLDCVRYALTELGEYEDAMLRAERTGDKRNNQKPSDARRELGQVGEMLGAAIVQLNRKRPLASEAIHTMESRLDSVATLAESIAKCLWYRMDMNSDAQWSFANWIALVQLHGWDAHALLVERYTQVREKHCTEVQP